MYNEYIVSLKLYIAQYLGLLAVVVVAAVIYYFVKKSMKKLVRQDKIFMFSLVGLIAVLCALRIGPVAVDIGTISESIETVKFESAYRQSRGFENEDLFGTPVTVELYDGTVLHLTSVDYFPNNVENSTLNYVTHSNLIVSYKDQSKSNDQSKGKDQSGDGSLID